MKLHNLPDALQIYLQQSFGMPTGIERIKGAAQRDSGYRVNFRRQAIIIKRARTSREWELYLKQSQFLNHIGVNIPRLFNAFVIHDDYWLVMESIPFPLPKERWGADSDLLKMLFRLHHGTWEGCPDLTNPFIPRWSEGMSKAMMENFSDQSILAIDFFDRLKDQCQQLFKTGLLDVRRSQSYELGNKKRWQSCFV